MVSDERLGEFTPPQRTLMGPGPCDVDPAVLRMMSAPPVGHLDPFFLKTMDEVRELLRQLFRTKNVLTFPISGTGTAGMETCLVNMIEPGDKVLVCVKGYFGERMCQMTKRLGGELVRLEGEWGRPFDVEALRLAIKQHSPKLVCIVHAETSTGVYQPLEGLADVVREHDAYLLVDCVTSLAGVPVEVDEWGWDACYSGTQKCVACPPGLSPVTFSDRAVERLEARSVDPMSWYFDVGLLNTYWGGDRAYHHTAPVNMIYGLREALRLIFEEGLEQRWARHGENAHALWAGLEAMGLPLVVEEAARLPSLTAVRIPEGIDDLTVRQRLLNEFNIEIGGGLGPFRGNVWRIGLMGYTSKRRNVFLALAALESVLCDEGFQCERGAAVAAAAASYSG